MRGLSVLSTAALAQLLHLQLMCLEYICAEAREGE